MSSNASMPFDSPSTNNMKELDNGDPHLSPHSALDITATELVTNRSNEPSVEPSGSEEHDEEASLDDDDDTASISTSASDISWGSNYPTDPATGKAKVRAGRLPVLYLPLEEAVYWGDHGHAPPGNTRTHDLDNNDLEIFESYYCTETEEDWNRWHPDMRLPPDEGIFWLEHGCLPPGSTRTHDLDGKPLVFAPVITKRATDDSEIDHVRFPIACE